MQDGRLLWVPSAKKKKSTRKTSSDMVHPCIRGPLPYFQGHPPTPPSTSPSPLWPLLPGMLILFPIVSSSLPTGNGWSPRIHKQLGSQQEVISLQHLQPGNRTAPAGRWKNRRCTLTHIHIYTNKCLTHKHPLTSPTAVGTGTTTQETECE